MKEFVEYLNTLHRVSGKNSNATAESNYNAKNKEFSRKILVDEDPIVDEIKDAITKDHKVLLTGYAGDGKTTIANIIAGKPLVEARTVIDNLFDKPLVVIKDLSEVGDDESFLLDDIINSEVYLLIVSNTGTIKKRLLALFYALKERFDLGENETHFESIILAGIEGFSNGYSGEIKSDNGKILLKTFNLVKRDNLKLAYRIFKNILDFPDWENGTENEKYSIVYINRCLLIADNYHALNQIMYIYRRVYEYGNRMTIRQLIEHFAYTVTGDTPSSFPFTGKSIKGLFFYNFFAKEAINSGMVGAKIVDEAKFGYNIDAKWKRIIWIGADDSNYKIRFSNSQMIKLYKRLYDSAKEIRSYHSQRLDLIRMLYFLNLELAVSPTDSNSQIPWAFCCSFLNSPGFYYFMKINNSGVMKYSEKQQISLKIMQVFKEHFIGMKIPEASSSLASGKKVYIAMARNSSNIKQTAQIILTSFEWNDPLKVVTDYRGIYQFALSIKEYGEELIEVPLPFLDYLISCQLGVVVDPAFAPYRKRLDNIKDGILKNRKNTENEEQLMLIAYMDRKKDLHIMKYIIQDEEIIYEDVE